ncbi:response regulator [Fluviicola taffensis]|uniref:Response regulator receiver n=1 Tax=Fluviicola taffensis (strain DSM 16823 / NCIMB 13979 / RW262) TaxID=755732 RepID=F2IJ57_FLUTR|nr:response regulator [Fluviicola taffensis]AEA44927.1 response regulator receiver [Fluviicola taffensis DSM 16823]
MEKYPFFGLRIQVLDDNPFYTTLYKLQLERELLTAYSMHQNHFKISTYTDSAEFLTDLPGIHSISFLDYNLGNNLTGLDVMDKIKRQTTLAKVYIVTDENNSFILRSCLDAGADGIIFKNNELMELSLMVIQQTINSPDFPYQLNVPRIN